MCFYIIKYAFPHHHTHISVCHFVGVYVYAGAINRSPTAANGLPKCANGLPIVQYMCVIMRCLWDIKIGEAQNTFVFLHFSTTHFIRRYLGNCATIRRVACPKKVRCLCQIPPTCKLIAHVNRANAVHCTFCIYGALGVTGHYFVDGSYLECKRCSLILITCTGI